ncbi:hypothetical protein LTR37_016211 [Vermiconidia calcicola]|uniref:Uncharacterized protein n=1 Tax=Vermiconidia calcicola TaxID=1690605 RepID=A0ACC3MQ33_9PEZI|nr:hypothetical protein LTR37_016211 [Vermiconidia calcicola]
MLIVSVTRASVYSLDLSIYTKRISKRNRTFGTDLQSPPENRADFPLGEGLHLRDPDPEQEASYIPSQFRPKQVFERKYTKGAYASEDSSSTNDSGVEASNDGIDARRTLRSKKCNEETYTPSECCPKQVCNLRKDTVGNWNKGNVGDDEHHAEDDENEGYSLSAGGGNKDDTEDDEHEP